jgi:hypothetical protein
VFIFCLVPHTQSNYTKIYTHTHTYTHLHNNTADLSQTSHQSGEGVPTSR